MVDAVFLSRPNTAPVVRRIDSTNAFLVRVADAEVRDGETVRDAFIATFRGSAAQVKRLFDYRLQTRNWTPASKELPFFAQLYLSVLIASADPKTYEIGNFRERLTESLGLNRDPVFDLRNLGRLWQAAASWSRQSQRKGLRQLLLPDPGHERIIGYSKGLAFPRYRDQLRLSALLSASSLSSDSPVDDIQREIDKNRSKFTEWFIDEYRSFCAHISRGEHQKATSTPFWAAVSDISWEYLPRRAQRNRWNLQLELDLADPFNAELFLYSNLPLKAPAPAHSAERLTFAFDDFAYRLLPRDNVIKFLLDLAPTQRRDGLARSVKDGLIAFGADDYGRWVATNNPQEGQHIWLLVSDVDQDASQKMNLGREAARYVVPLPGIPWVLFGPYCWTEQLRSQLSARLPHVDALQLRIKPAVLRLVGGTALAEGYLFLPPVLPKVSMVGAASIEWSARLASGSIIGPFQMLREEASGLFTFSSSHAAQVQQPAQVTVTAYDIKGEEIGSKAFEVIAECRSTDLKQPTSFRNWLEDGVGGQLVEVNATPQPVHERHELIGSEEVRPVAHLRDELRVQAARTLPLSELRTGCRTSMEVLVAKFLRARTIPQTELFDIVQSCWHLDWKATWTRIEDLVQNGWVRRMFTRTWHGVAYAAVLPHFYVTRQPTSWRLRFVGLMGGALRMKLAHAVEQAGGSCRALVSPIDYEVMGAIEVNLPICEDPSGFVPVAQVDDEVLPNVLPSWTAILQSEPEVPRGDKSVWSRSAGAFLSDALTGMEKATLERWRREGVQDLFVLIREPRQWTTRSRTWALLALMANLDSYIGGCTVDGHLVLQPGLSLPACFGRHVLLRGGGISYVDAAGRRVYLNDPASSFVGILERWLQQQDVSIPNLQRRDFALKMRMRRGRLPVEESESL